ncbi:MAG: hypothetical protein M0T74_01490 [Desulfitobacterium hafniense]|nr:hypothetical protein [Desulfitobacterium hafniense]
MISKNLVKRIIGYCPYCIVGKQVTSKISGIKQVVKKSNPPDDNEKRLIGKMKTGRNIALIGVFCPIFWSALFMGASGSILLLNAIHSGIFICIGGAYFFLNFITLRRLRLYSADSQQRHTRKSKDIVFRYK